MKNDGIKKSTFKVALCGVIAALSLALMMFSAVIPIGTYAIPCVAGVIITAVVLECGSKWALGVYAAVSILSVFLAGDKEAVIYFIALFGYYPVIKCLIEGKIKNKPLQYILKFALFNAAAIGSFFAAMFILSVPAEEFEIFGFYVPWAFLIVGNLFFILYDYAVTMLVMQYVRVLRNKIFKRF